MVAFLTNEERIWRKQAKLFNNLKFETLNSSNMVYEHLHGNWQKWHLSIAHAKHVLESSNTMSHKAYT